MSNNLNSIYLIGNLTRDMELKYSSNGLAIGKSSIAVNKEYKKGDDWTKEVSYFNFVVFGKAAEFLNERLTKGKQIFIDGSLKQNRWQDQEGKAKNEISIIVNTINIIENINNKNSSNSENNDNKSSGTNNVPDDFVDDIPF